MALVIITSKGNEQEWQAELKRLDDELDIQIYPHDTDRSEVDFALAWNPPIGVFKEYPNLKCIASTGAGVDHIVKDPELPDKVAITRVVDERLTEDMTAYLVTYVMAHIRSAKKYRQQKYDKKWRQHVYATPENTRVGIMGMGELGRHAAERFHNLGFIVKGWSRSKQSALNISMYSGKEEFADFLGNLDILICLLPLTRETRNILAKSTFELLPRGAYVINVARGQHLVEEDLLAALDEGQLSGACLDVFRKEPLPKDHPFWNHEKITLTPHIASITSLKNVAPQILENYHRMRKGQPLRNEVSREKGY